MDTIAVEGNRITVTTRTLIAEFDSGVLVSLTRRSDNQRLITPPAQETAALGLLFAGGELVPLTAQPGDRVTALAAGPNRAEFRFESWNGEGVLEITTDEQSGDLLVEPSGFSSRPGLRACRWTLAGIAEGLELVAPLFQGVRMKLEDPRLTGERFEWPVRWEAGLAILQGSTGGMWVHCRDERWRYKALAVGPGRALALDTESYGPLERNLSAGGIAWRINVHEGSWETPAAVYRQWLASTRHPERTERPSWVKEVRFAVSWCPTDEAVLHALAARLDPRSVLLHIPNWRTDGYDENYPTFTAGEKGRAFVKKAQAMGFRAMPHCNSIDMDPTHPVYAAVRDFQYRDIESRRVQGWTWVNGKVLPVPESNAARLMHRDKKTMVKVHPGLALWRSILAEHVKEPVESLELEAVFLDVTLNTWNLSNCLVDDSTPTEGMVMLIQKVAGLREGLAVGGEGRNETTMLAESFGQVHLFKWVHHGKPLAGVDAVCPLNEFLFGQWCRSFGYTSLSGRDADEQERMRVTVAVGAIPTVTIGKAEDISSPSPGVAEMMKLAGGRL